MGLLESVRDIAKEYGLKETKYRIDATKIVRETEKILREDYTQTLMISAVLGQMVEARERERLPAPAFFAFIEMLSRIPDAPRDTKSESSTEIEDRTTRIIELMTTLVSVLCEWSEKGVAGVADDCPESLRDMAKSVFRKTKLLQGGLWTCISCGEIVDVKDTRALMCTNCDSSISRSDIHQRFDQMAGRDRTGYGRTFSEERDD
jgi:predicted transcriptional regulator